MAQLKKLSWVALVVPVVLCCAGPAVFLVVGATLVSTVGGVVAGSPWLAAAVLVVGGVTAAVLVRRGQHLAGPIACCAVPTAQESTDAETRERVL